MEDPISQPDPMPVQVTRNSSGRGTASPEFEFLTSATSPLLSADELFVDGLLLPLSLLHLHPNLHPPPPPDPLPHSNPHPSQPPRLKPDTAPGSKRWKDITIFKKGDKIKNKIKNITTNSGDNNNTAININLWPFSRSRSAGTGSTRPKPIPNPTRKSSSAPCSRSNSAGESKSRKWPASPARVGVHLGRASPVWQQARRTKQGSSVEGMSRVKRVVPPVVRVLNLNVPMCIGGEGLVAGEGTRGGGNAFSFRSMFGKKLN